MILLPFFSDSFLLIISFICASVIVFVLVAATATDAVSSAVSFAARFFLFSSANLEAACLVSKILISSLSSSAAASSALRAFL